MKTLFNFFVGILCFFAFAGSSAAALTLDFTVESHAMPWLSNAGLNPSFAYGVQDGNSPTIVDSSRGFSFAPGGTFTIRYIDGFTSAFTPFPPFTFEDANGLNGTYSSFTEAVKYYSPFYPIVYDSPGIGFYYPTRYIPLEPFNPNSTYYLACLVGTFANSTGTIMGHPFFIGDGPVSVTVPAGATRLQLGLNDDLFSDNRGVLLVEVNGPGHVPICPCSVPLPAPSLLFGSGLLGLVSLRKVKKG
jgi:hypothetical protein